MKGPQPISGAVEELLAVLGLPAISTLVRLEKAWESLCGGILAANTAPAELRNGVLTVLVRNHGWAQELQFSKPVLLERIRAVAGAEGISDLRFTVAALSSTTPGEETENIPATCLETGNPSGLGGVTPPSLPDPEELSAVADPELRAILRSIGRKARNRNL